MSLRSVRERINIILYDSKEQVLFFMKLLSLVVSLVAIGALVYYYGYPQTEDTRLFILNLIKASFSFYVLHYFIKILYNFSPLSFLKKTWFEALIILFLIAEGISYNTFDTLIINTIFQHIGIQNASTYTALFIQTYLLVIVLLEISKSSTLIPNIKVHPSTLFILSFLIIIICGTAFLMMPEMSTASGGLNFVDALFMSTSATCVTGLATVDLATLDPAAIHFTFKGHFVILGLIKLGGLNIIAFGSFLALASKFGVGVRQHDIIEDFVNKDSIVSAKGMFRKVIFWSISVEIVGSLLMYIFWNPTIPFTSTGDKLFYSIFHSVSAFNNAGLSTFPGGFFNDYLKFNYGIHIISSFLIFFGALGLMAMFDMFDYKRLRERMKKPWVNYSFNTKIALYFSFALFAIGVVVFYILEKDNTLKGHSFFGAIVTSIMQSVTTRSAGFNTVDIKSLTIPAILFMIILMFIGASSSSTGGGIKTSTFAILWASVRSTIKGSKHVELFKRTIGLDLVNRAFSVFLFFSLGIAIGIFLLSITEWKILAQEGRSILDLVFEEFSAFGTVGLSTGITQDLSLGGKTIIILSMFIGRVGTLTVAFMFGRKLISRNYKYPRGHTMVG